MSAAIEKILDKERLSLQLVQSTDSDGVRHYAYVVIQRTRRKEFEKLVAAGMTDFTGIGTVVASGEGIPPEGMTEKVLAAITQKGK